MSREDGYDRVERKANVDKNNAKAVVVYEQFQKEFRTPEAALNSLFRRFQHRLLICRNRKCLAKLPEDCVERSVRCPKCGRVNHVTADTFLAYIKRPLAWLAAIFLQERGVILSSSGFAKLIGGHSSTCANILRKTELAILNSINDKEAEEYGTETFVPSYCKRSTETPRREHPSSEQKAMEMENGIAEFEQERETPFASEQEWINFSPTEEEPAAESEVEELADWQVEMPGENSGDNSLGEPEDGTLDATPDEPGAEFDVSGPLTKIEKELLDLIGKEGINFDLLCDRTPHPTGTVSAVCTMLELKGLVAQQIGNRYVPVEKITSAGGMKSEQKRSFSGTSRSAKPQTTSATSAKPASRIELSQLQQQVANDFMEYVRTYHHGISRKNVQLYFVRFWYYQSREHLPEHWLSNACFRFADCLEKGVGSYISPLRIKIPPLLTQ